MAIPTKRHMHPAKNQISLGICPVFSVFRSNKKISVFRVTGLKSLGRVGTHIFFYYFFFLEKYFFMHFERHFTF